MTPISRRDSRRRPTWLLVALVLIAGGVTRMAWDLVAHWDQLRSGGDLRFGLLLGLRCAALSAGVVALSLAVRSRAAANPGHGGRLSPAAALYGVAYVLLTAILLTSLAHLVGGLDDDRVAVRSVYRSALLLAGGVWVALAALLPSRMTAAPRGLPRAAGVLLVNLLVVLLALEGVTVLFSRAFPTRLMWNEASARSAIRANRLPPGSRYLGFRANSGGYYDEEFFRGGPDDYVVALVADSFGVGVVPHKYNFATIAERRMARGLRVRGRVAVHNFGVPAVGLPEYAWLLENEVPATAPARVVLGLFVGNDISGLASRREPGWYSLQQFRVFELARRLLALGRAGRGDRNADGLEGRPRRGPTSDADGGTFDRETFLEIELASVELCNTRNRHMERLYRASFPWLTRLRRAAGDKLLVVLIPDEYQVNDELYDALMRRVGEPRHYDRLYPQKRIAAYCAERGIEVLDLLPALRRANETRSVYRLRDTHWNARGNRIAGEAIGRYLIDRAAL